MLQPSEIRRVLQVIGILSCQSSFTFKGNRLIRSLHIASPLVNHYRIPQTLTHPLDDIPHIECHSTQQHPPSRDTQPQHQCKDNHTTEDGHLNPLTCVDTFVVSCTLCHFTLSLLAEHKTTKHNGVARAETEQHLRHG